LSKTGDLWRAQALVSTNAEAGMVRVDQEDVRNSPVLRMSLDINNRLRLVAEWGKDYFLFQLFQGSIPDKQRVHRFEREKQ
jgi:hypothetical protein